MSLFAVKPSHVASTKIECQNFSYVYRSRKHWECKYYDMTHAISPIWAFSRFKIVKVMWCMTWVFHCIGLSNFLKIMCMYTSWRCYVAVCNNYAICNKLQTALIATQFVIHRISNCVVMATRFVMYYKLRQNFIIFYWKGEKKIDERQNASLQSYLTMNSARHQSIRARHAKLPINTTIVQNAILPPHFCEIGGGGGGWH